MGQNYKEGQVNYTKNSISYGCVGHNYKEGQVKYTKNIVKSNAYVRVKFGLMNSINTHFRLKNQI